MGARTMTMVEANEIAQKRIAELEAENQRMREASQRVVDRMRGSGGINPDAAAALLKLAVVLEGEHDIKNS